ncbi:bifunctional folylpolyglutamate synthase/dihydrofolate synthase [bacterium]|nr:bifunctional folylpolyglutamate synthase/dihydrofolate synthase [bacterium]
MSDNYQSAVRLLTSKGRFRIELGLERIKKILGLLNEPQNDFKIIHIAGTNGKGSVCSITAKILECAGFKTALYTSPHLIDYTERIKINSADIPKEDFSKYLDFVVGLADKNSIELTEFEILTAVAFKYFSDKKVDYALIETGLGGRFDATNAADNKILTVITSISADHKAQLGDTIEKIAFEKAGIMRENTPVIVGKNNKGFSIIKEKAEKINATLIIPKSEVKIEFKNNKNYAVIDGKEYEFPLLGLYQKENLELVYEIINYLSSTKYSPTGKPSHQPSPIEEEADCRLGFNPTLNFESAIREGLKTVQWNSRFQYIKEKKLIIDGAHNEDGAKKLRESLDFYFPSENRRFIFGAMNTKEYQKVAKILFRPQDRVYFYQFKDKRSISFEEFKPCCEKAIEICSPSPRERAGEMVLPKIQDIINSNIKDTITISCGSFYVTGEVLNLL